MKLGNIDKTERGERGKGDIKEVSCRITCLGNNVLDRGGNKVKHRGMGKQML